MRREEHETVITIDYYNETVIVWTTRKGVRNQIIERLNTDKYLVSEGKYGWRFKIPQNLCRDGHMITQKQ